MDKDYILSEIRRIAEMNGGAPPGRAKLQSETGIKESHWLGKYWIRWNDALAEAGFPPNRLTQIIPDSELLTSLAVLVSELGHFPVMAELKLRARQDKSFPSHNTWRRFGNKNALARRLRTFA